MKKLSQKCDASASYPKFFSEDQAPSPQANNNTKKLKKCL